MGRGAGDSASGDTIRGVEPIPAHPRPATRGAPVRRAAIANLGCKVNQAEMDAVERLLRARGVELVHGHEDADLVVVNTCTVTSIADRKSRQAVRRARRTNPDAEVFVTGCSVAIDPESLAGADPLARLFDNDSKGRLMAELEGLLELGDGQPMPTLSGVDRVAEPAAGPADGRNGGRAGGRSTGSTGGRAGGRRRPTRAPSRMLSAIEPTSTERAPSSRSRTAAHSIAPTASFRALAAPPDRLPRKLCSPRSDARRRRATARSC